MGKCKYIIAEYNNVALFSNTAVHAEMARHLMGGIVGAGFMRVKHGDVEVWGESISLGVGIREEDRDIIQEFLKG